MEYLYKIIFLIMFLASFVNFAKAEDAIAPTKQSDQNLAELLSDVRLVREVNEINSDSWIQDTSDVNNDGLKRIEFMLKAENTIQD